MGHHRGFAIKAECAAQVLAGVRTGLRIRGPRVDLCTLLVPNYWGKGCLGGGSEIAAHECCCCPACFTFSVSRASEVWRVLTTTSDVANIAQGPGFRLTKCYPSVCASVVFCVPNHAVCQGPLIGRLIGPLMDP